MTQDMRHWMRLLEAALNETPLPADFEHSNWGYWIEPDGTMRPVARHSHHLMYKTGYEAYACGRIRVTSISDPSLVKTETGKRVFSVNFFTPFVTKRALRSLLSLLTSYEFDTYDVVGMNYGEKEAFGAPAPEGVSPDDHTDTLRDPRSITDSTSRSAAVRSVRAFLQTARDEPPPQLDATPEAAWKPAKRRSARSRF